ncbi:serine protease 55-like [Ambystoma mexicanum]|uniref:serine protease 55-like n=1 Tax=Ambystoma mexicanum TaxID=8296 RepID=UPI0037E7395F
MNSVSIVVGDLKSNSSTKKTYPIKEVIVNEAFSKDNNSNDIALLLTSESIRFHNFVQPVCYPDDFRLPIESLKNCWITTWALTNTSVKIPALQKAVLYHVKSCCFKMKENMICTNDDPHSNSGDSMGDNGGPLVCQDEREIWLIFGIVSFRSTDCNSANVFARIVRFKDWVIKTTALEGKPFIPQGASSQSKDLEVAEFVGG